MEWLYFVILGIAVQSASGNFNAVNIFMIRFLNSQGMLPV